MTDRVATNPDRMAANWRVAITALLNLFLSMHRAMTSAMPIGPTELLIYATVSVANVQKLTRERSIREDFASTDVLPREWVVPISRNAIATASGLPRETVRRQVGRMIDTGLLVEDSRGGVTLPIGVIKDRGFEPLLEAMMTDFARSADALLRMGVIQIQTD